MTRKSAIGETMLDPLVTPEPAEGEVVLALDRFSLTTNNITYAAYGDAIGYWRVFPTGRDDYGLMPVWGFADVAASRAEGIEVGARVVLRTFSKAYALAGLRLGYALCGSEEVRNAFDQIRVGFNVGRLAQAGAKAALTDPDHTAMILDNNERERERMRAALSALGCRVLESATNFIAVELPGPGQPVVSALREEADIWIQAIPYPGFENFIRISVCGPEDTDALLAALPDVLRRTHNAGEN